MFDASNNAFLPELEFLLEASMHKKCRKQSFNKKYHKNQHEQICFEQNELRSILKRILPREMKPIEDSCFGVDYIFRGKTIDQKFSFGLLGENTIKIRVDERRLINNSDYTMVIKKNQEAEFFQTKKLSLFVKKNWGIVQKRLVGKKENYSEYAIQLDEFYLTEGITPIETTLDEKSIINAILRIQEEESKNLIQDTLEVNKTILDSQKRICFEPIIAQIALQIISTKT